MRDIAEWLGDHGFKELLGTFADQGIDLELLAQLTDADFKELGLSIAQRRRLLTAVAEDPPGLPVWPSTTADHPAPSLPFSIGERRQLTVMFCDLVGSTPLSMQVDPEVLGVILNAYQNCCQEALARFGGQITKYMGDGILACFGYPQANEHDAERAIHAAIAITQAVPSLELPQQVKLQVRIGIATGLVLVGETIGKGTAQERPIVGDTPNLAARLQSVAFNNSIVISSRTYSLIRGLFECEDIGPLTVKGIDAPITAWQILREADVESRFEAKHQVGLSPLVGRTEELDLLLRRWHQVEEGGGRTVILIGDAGIGKSRLALELTKHILRDHIVLLRYYCSPYHMESSLYPIINHLERAAGFVRTDSPQNKLDKLKKLLLTARSDDEAFLLMGQLLSLPIADDQHLKQLTPQDRKYRTFRAMINQVNLFASQYPVLVIFEDLHWADPTTLEFLNLLAETIQGSRILLVGTTRPVANLPWTNDSNFTVLSLSRLSPKESSTIIDHAIGDNAIPSTLRDQILKQTEGIPLYLEECTKTVLETHLLTRDTDRFAESKPSLTVPATLHDSFMSRLDRRPELRLVTQMAATLGRTFTSEVLSAVLQISHDTIGLMLRELEAVDIMRSAQGPSGITYRFKHALLQDLAYQSTLKSVRPRQHERIARILESQFPEIVSSQPELIAFHFNEAGLGERAIRHWLVAGKRAADQSANTEAISLLMRALEVVKQLPETDQRPEIEYELCLSLIPPLITAKGYSSVDLENAFSRGLELSARLGNTTGIFPILFGRYVFESIRGRNAIAMTYALEASRLAGPTGDDEAAILVGRLLGTTKMFNGELETAKTLLEDALGKYQPDLHRTSAYAYGQDHAVVSASYLTLTLWHLAHIQDAKSKQIEAVRYARSLSHLNTLGLALTYQGFFAALCRDVCTLSVVSAELNDLTQRNTLPVWSAANTVIIGRMLVEEGEVEYGIHQLEKGLTELEKMEIRVFKPMFSCWLAEAYFKMNEFGRALEIVDVGFECTKDGEHWFDGELYRLKGEIMLAIGRLSSAIEECLNTALVTCRNQKSRMIELRTVASLSRMRSGAMGFEARQRLHSVLAALPNLEKLPDVKEASELYEKLRGSAQQARR